MKVCPVCKATSFKDMDVCFGCMHRFGEPEESDFERGGNTSGDDAPVLAVEAPVLRESGSATDAAPDGGGLSQAPDPSGALSGFAAEGSGAKTPSPSGPRPPVVAESGMVAASVAEEPVVLPAAGGGFDLVISIRPA